VELGKKLADELAPAIAEHRVADNVDVSTRKLISTIHQFRKNSPGTEH
jgi:hypothetical protein